MAQENVHLSADTTFYIEDAVGSGTYIEVEDVSTFGGEIGQVGTFLDSTTIKDTAKTYIAGLADAPDLTISFLYAPTTNQTNFINSAQAGESRQARIVFAGGVVTADFEVAMSGFTLSDPAPDTILTGSVTSKASSFVWS